MLTEKDLLRIKREIDEMKQTLSKLEGKREQLLQQLLSEWGCSSVEEAEAKLTELETKSESIEKRITKALADLNEHYEFA